MKPKTYERVNATPSTPQHCDECDPSFNHCWNGGLPCRKACERRDERVAELRQSMMSTPTATPPNPNLIPMDSKLELTATPRTDALWQKHHAFSNEDEATEALCDFRDLGNTLETELTRLRAEVEQMKDYAFWKDTAQTRAENLERASEQMLVHEQTIARLRAKNERLKQASKWHENNNEACSSDAEIIRLCAEVERLTKQLRDEESWWKEKHDYQARADRAEAAQLDAIASCDSAVIRAERAQAHAARVNNADDMLVIERDALAKDKARLDWLLEHGVQTQHFYTDHMSGGCYAQYYKTRDAIDAAMKS